MNINFAMHYTFKIFSAILIGPVTVSNGHDELFCYSNESFGHAQKHAVNFRILFKSITIESFVKKKKTKLKVVWLLITFSFSQNYS